MTAGERLSQLQGQWTAGAWALTLLGASCAAAACVAGILVGCIALAARVGQSEALAWWEISAVLWLPIGVGLVLPNLARFSRRIEADRAALKPIF